ncbi:hypothetical protein [Nonomuraea sp. NPDC001699]
MLLADTRLDRPGGGGEQGDDQDLAAAMKYRPVSASITRGS